MREVEDVIQAASAGAGSAFSTAALFPVEFVKTRLQASSSGSAEQYRGSLDVVRHIARQQGLTGFYRGVSAKVVEQVARAVVYFYLYAWLSRRAAPKGSLSTGANLAVGYAAGVGGILLTSPFEIIATRLQTATGKGAAYLATARDLLAEGGVAAFYRSASPRPRVGLSSCPAHSTVRRGLGASLVLCANPAIQYTVFDQLKALLLARAAPRRGGAKGALTALQAFLLGALAKAIATVITFPYIRAKVVLQAADRGSETVRRAREETEGATAGRTAEEMGGSADDGAASGGDRVEEGKGGAGEDPLRVDAADSAVEALRKLSATDGVTAWYKGMAPQLLKGVLAAALMLMVKERIERAVRRVLKRAVA